MGGQTVTSDDAIFFMDMVKSSKSPNHVSGFYQTKPYYKILDDPDSDAFKRFIKVYHAEKHVLTEREQTILADLYGITKPRVNLKQAGLLHHVTQERIRQIRQNSERKITSALYKRFKHDILALKTW